MTIGIAAWGANAGRAVFEALRAAEKVATGSIGGFAVFAAITEDGRVVRQQTQRGGTATLFLDAETTGTPPPDDVAGARLAAVISSGPDRPEPLSRFLPADGAVGLVTGHRLPNAPGRSGKAVNLEVLELMRAGRTAAQAVETVMADNPESDAGVIAASVDGAIFAGNSQRVARRPDLGSARRESVDRSGRPRAVVEVIHNAIRPVRTLAPLLADIAIEAMVPSDVPDGWVTVRAGTPVEAGDRDALLVDDDDVALRILTTDHRIVTGEWNCAAIGLGAEVRQGGALLGRTILEPNTIVEDGRLRSMSGQTGLRIGYRME